MTGSSYCSHFALLASLIQNSAPYATGSALQDNSMNLHEYQSKQLFAGYAIPMPKDQVADSPDGAVAAAEALGGSIWVV
jgi:succinyl-CoA synthetase beta subunit